jgi:hypothetical protein
MSGESASPARRRKFAYAVLCLGLTAGAIPVGRLTGIGDLWIHTVIETTATLLACMAGAISLLRYYARNSLAYLLLGTGFLGAGILNAVHAVVTSPACAQCTPSALPDLIPWSGVISGIFLSLLMCVRMVAPDRERSPSERHKVDEWIIYMLVGASILASCAV